MLHRNPLITALLMVVSLGKVENRHLRLRDDFNWNSVNNEAFGADRQIFGVDCNCGDEHSRVRLRVLFEAGFPASFANSPAEVFAIASWPLPDP